MASQVLLARGSLTPRPVGVPKSVFSRPQLLSWLPLSAPVTSHVLPARGGLTPRLIAVPKSVFSRPPLLSRSPSFAPVASQVFSARVGLTPRPIAVPKMVFSRRLLLPSRRPSFAPVAGQVLSARGGSVLPSVTLPKSAPSLLLPTSRLPSRAPSSSPPLPARGGSSQFDWACPPMQGPENPDFAFNTAAGKLGHIFEAIGGYIDMSVPEGTLKRDRLAWGRWLGFCSQVAAGGINPWRLDAAAHSGADPVGHFREGKLLTEYMAYCREIIPPRSCSDTQARPASSYNMVAGVRRIQRRHGIKTVTCDQLSALLKGFVM